MYTSFSLLAYPRGNDITKNGEVPLYMRITVDGKRAEFSLKQHVKIDNWDSRAGKVKGNTEVARDINRYITEVKGRLYQIQKDLYTKGDPLTSVKIKNTFLGKVLKQKMLLEIFGDHNDQVDRLVGKDFAAGTAERYRTAKKHVSEYITKEYKVKDIPVQDVDHQFITGFEYYLKTERNCGHNTAVKYITNFKKIIRIAYANNWIQNDPFLHWKAKLKIVDREFLTDGEIQKLIEKDFHTDRLELVRDIFIFSCFTGLAYADVKKLTVQNIVIGIDGHKWIKINRSKTDSRSNIPLLPTAIEIIKKYSFDLVASSREHLLPILTNQKMNAYLKEIADLCEIDKNLTFHLARHTFATTVTLLNGVPIESVSKMLGHKNLKTTQHYAKILDQKVSEDMLALRTRLKQV